MECLFNAVDLTLCGIDDRLLLGWDTQVSDAERQAGCCRSLETDRLEVVKKRDGLWSAFDCVRVVDDT